MSKVRERIRLGPAFAAIAAFALFALAISIPVAQGRAAPSSLPATRIAQQALPRVTFTPAEGASILVHGTYPQSDSQCLRPVQPVLHARYGGAIEVGKDHDGRLFLIADLPLEEYVKGIAEVPRTWPMEALKAQAVAARSYALAHLRYPDETGERLGYQLCATEACQVYRGSSVSNGPYGERWREAVEATAGQVLLYDGRPADTLYSSTSNGRTLGNEEVFAADPLPYLRPVEENDDGASPLSHWQVRIPLADVGRFLRAAGEWSGGEVSSVRRDGPVMIVQGGGTTAEVGVVDFRLAINSWGPCLDPDGYPGTNLVNGARVPQAIPSRWFGASTSGALVLTGRGWGHGVGMIQWGAYGKAQRGLSYSEILAAYYGGLTPVPYATPERIRVGVAVGLTSVQVHPSGPVASSAGPPGGPWLVRGGKQLRVARYSSPPPKEAEIEPGTLEGPSEARSGRRIRATLFVPQLSVARLVLVGKGAEHATSPAYTVEEGRRILVGQVPAVPSGDYELRAIVSDGVDEVRTPPTIVRVTGTAPAPSPPPSTSPPGASPSVSSAPGSGPRSARPSDRTVPLAIGAGVAVIVVSVLVLLVWRRQNPRSGGFADVRR